MMWIRCKTRVVAVAAAGLALVAVSGCGNRPLNRGIQIEIDHGDGTLKQTWSGAGPDSVFGS